MHLFMISQHVPVHTYPTHALRFLFSVAPFDLQSERLVALSQAHSLFVLLLQSLVYSSQNLVIPPESSHPSRTEKLPPSIPELTSPAPLSYKAPPSTITRSPLAKSKLKFLSSSTRRLSKGFFAASKPPPLPLAEPSALRAYSSTWRRHSRHTSGTYAQSDSDNDLAPPRRHYVSSTPTSATHSQSSLSRSSTPTPPTSNSSPSPPPSRIRFPLSPLSAPTPHDLIHALSPTRAPVLRTYVPCTAPSSSQETIIRCEEQLINAQLWPHLSIGDIVVNLGHVPMSDEPEKPLPKVPDNNSNRTTSSSLRRSVLHSPPPPVGNWLLFNGTFLVPFTSTLGAPVPVPDALTLPSPFYYTHVLPRPTNPVFVIRWMPRFAIVPTPPSPSHPSPSPIREEKAELEEADIPMRLVRLPARVSTTQGSGVALVRRYKWLARVFVLAPRCERGEQEIGLGWQGEWIVEGEGTKEGRDMLLDFLLGRGRAQAHARMKGTGKGREVEQVEWEWELVRERCKKHRKWFKLLDVRIAGEDGSETVAESSTGP
ncbi:hypothetical protein H0H92_015097 [Tricholoma furcatifolium]|nr:hypothetical protein H0H92_015097 [Tricholoma furcatifolium]